MIRFSSRFTSVVLAGLFMAGLAWALFTLFQAQATGIPASFYIILGVATVCGSGALVLALMDRREIIVYRDRKESSDGQAQAKADENKSTISLDIIKNTLKKANTTQDVLQSGLNAICKQLEAGQGAIYAVEPENEKRVALLKAGYALTLNENNVTKYNLGEGLIGQAASTGQTLYLDDIPEGYIKIISGLGSASPRFLLIAAVKHGEAVKGVVEIASFTEITADKRKFVEESIGLMAEKLSTT
jgi:methyl-accepting chemotaxis protein